MLKMCYMRRIVAALLITQCVKSTDSFIADTVVEQVVPLLLKYAIPKVASWIGVAQEDDTAVMKQYIDSAKDSILQRIAELETDLKDSIELASQKNILRTYAYSITSAMINLDHFVDANDPEKDIYKTVFLETYVSDGVLMKTRALPDLFAHAGIGNDKTLIRLILDTHNCNITFAHEFFTSYVRLLAYGVLAEFQYTMFRFNNSENERNKVANYWKPFDAQIFDAFTEAVNSCTSKWESLAKTDIENAQNADDLWVLNNRWLPWKNNDVIFAPKRGTFQFTYHNTLSRSVVVSKTNGMRFSVFYNEETIERGVNQDIIKAGESVFRAAITGKDDLNAAQHVGEAVEAYLSDIAHVHENIIVLFEEGNEITECLSSDTPSIRLNLERVSLDSKSGRFRIYVYVTNKTEAASGKLQTTTSMPEILFRVTW